MRHGRGRRSGALLAVGGALLLAACEGDPVEPRGPRAPAAHRAVTGAVLVGAGDIATCTSEGDEATAALLDGIEGTVFTAGDNAYPNGTPEDFASCYHPSWGRHRGRTYPSPGNHEYLTPAAAGYFGYFGERAGPPGLGYYSYDVGGWHVVVLNSMLELADPITQKAWLIRDLYLNRGRRCTLAYWHHPLFSSGEHGDQFWMRGIWWILYAFGAEVVVNGHDHSYERFAPQTPDGRRDDARGIRELVVGTGGASLRGFPTVRPNSEVRYNAAPAVLRLTLGDGLYGWELLRAPDAAVVDSGEGRCH